jgi:uncharacterized protein
LAALSRNARARTNHACEAKAASQVASATPGVSWKKQSTSTPNFNGGSDDPTLAFDLPADHRRRVLNILRAQLPQSTEAWVYGSRATGRARSYSDLDLAIDAGRRLTLDEIARFTEAFGDSDLPYRVDLVDWHDIGDRWRLTIVAEHLTLTEAAHPDSRKRDADRIGAGGIDLRSLGDCRLKRPENSRNGVVTYCFETLIVGATMHFLLFRRCCSQKARVSALQSKPPPVFLLYYQEVPSTSAPSRSRASR